MKALEQNFSDFRGLDVRSSDLTRPLNAAKELENYSIEKNFSLGGLQGIKTAAEQLTPTFGVHNYIYRDPDTGKTEEELLAVGPELYRLKTDGALTITYSGSGTTWGYHFYLNSSGTFQLDLYEDGAVTNTQDCKTGLEDQGATPYDMDDLQSAIDGFTGFAGATNDTGPYAAILPLVKRTGIVKASEPSDSIAFNYWETIDSFVDSVDSTPGNTFRHYYYNHEDEDLPNPTFINKNNVCYFSMGGTTPLMKYAGGGVVAAGMMETIEDDVELDSTANTPALVGFYRYYVRMVTKDTRGNFIYGGGAKTQTHEVDTGEAPRLNFFTDATNTRNLNPKYGVQFGSNTNTGSTTLTFDLDTRDESDLPHYGYEEIRVGDPVVVVADEVFFRYVTAIDRAAGTVTLDDTYDEVASGTNYIYRSTLEWGGLKGLTISSTQNNVSTITCTNNGVAEGDHLYFTTEQEWFKVTAASASSITIDGIVSVTSSDSPSCICVEVYRTENGGGDKFYFNEGIALGDLSANHIDTTADASLGIEVIIPGIEPSPIKILPNVITEHQDIIIAAGGRTRTGRLYYEDFYYLESFPLATNFYDVPAQDAGVITALWSDGLDQLAVFKDSAYYSVIGDFKSDFPTLITEPVTENDYGIGSQNSIVKVRGVNVGVGRLGFVAFSRGQIDYELSKQLDSEFLVSTFGLDIDFNTKLQVGKSHGVNDRFKQQALFFIPALAGASGAHEGANANSKMYILDYSEGTWSRRTFATVAAGLVTEPFWPMAGMTIYKDELWLASCQHDGDMAGSSYDTYRSFFFRRKNRELADDNGDYLQDYTDQHLAINYDLKEQWRFGESPSLNTYFQFLKVYLLPQTDFVPFDLQIRTYINFDEDTVVDNRTISVTSTTRKILIKLKAVQAECMMVRFTTNTIFEKPTITGYELITSNPERDLEGVK
jgi:hypothetical protein